MKTYTIHLNQFTYEGTWPTLYNGHYWFTNTLNKKSVCVKKSDHLLVKNGDTWMTFQNPSK